MAVKIRLKRLGSIRNPHFRIVVMDSRQKRDGKAIEEVGKYHPKNDPSFIEVNSERVQHWLKVGAQPTEAVVAILKRSGDWQKFTGDSSPSGIDPQPEKTDKTEIFNKALADTAGAPTVEAFTKKKADEAKKAEEAAAEESSDAEESSESEAPAEESEAPAEETSENAEG